MKKPLLLIILLFFVIACNDGGKVSGTATDTENTIAGVIQKTDGSIASGANVRMLGKLSASTALSSTTDSRPFLETTTDSLGAFRFDSILSDTFDLEVRWLLDQSLDEVVLLKNLVASASSKTNLGKIKLQKAAYVQSLFKYDTTGASINLGSHFEIHVEGSSYQTSVLSGESFVLGMGANVKALVVFPADVFMIQKLIDAGISHTDIYQRVEVDIVEGDTLKLDSIVWKFPVQEPVFIDSTLGRIKGRVIGLDGKPQAWANVRLIEDIYGFGFAMGQGLFNNLNTVTDTLGWFELPFPSAVEDSFRIEVDFYEYGNLIAAGVSEYLHKDELTNKSDTITTADIVLQKPSSFMGFITLISDSSDPDSSNCTLNSVVLGFKGTSHFVRQITCNDIQMNSLPAGSQELLFYTGDYNVIQVLINGNESMDTFVQMLTVNLPEGESLSQQGITYTPPTKTK